MGMKIFIQNVFFTVDSDSYTHRHHFKLKKIRGNTVRHTSIFSDHTVNDWNSHLSSVVLSNSVNCFKSRHNDALKKHLLKFDADCFQLCQDTHLAEAILRTRRQSYKSLTYSILLC